MSSTKADTREAVAKDAMYLTVAYINKLMPADREAEYLRRFREDAFFRREVVYNLATDHMSARLDPEEAARLTRREQRREEAAMENEQMRVMASFMKKRPKPEDIRLRQMTWTYLMKKYGYPAVDVVTWELV